VTQLDRRTPLAVESSQTRGAADFAAPRVVFRRFSSEGPVALARPEISPHNARTYRGFVPAQNHWSLAMADAQSLTDMEGVVKWFDARKGFGFIVGPEGQDIFVHFSVIEQSEGFRALRDGERVTYSASNGDKGWSATKARSLGSRVPPAERVNNRARTS
jgi:CspA family cold shock protein